MKKQKEKLTVADTLQQLSDAIAQTVETVADGIVRIEARRRLPATGVVWSENLIVTAHHVIEKEEDITIGLNDGTTVTASLVGRDPHNDLALLKTDATLTPANWAGDEDLRVGHLVLALGRPGEKVQVTLGVTSALVNRDNAKRKREEAAERGPRGPHGRHRHGRRRRGGHGWGRALVDGYIQTDVTMYPGFSGGALVSGDGKIHGLNTSGFTQGTSIAVPVSTIRSTVATLLSDGKMQQGYLGVGVQPARLPENVAESLDQETGLLVVSVEKDSPAQKAGFLVGDILVSLDGESTEYVDELLILLASSKVGETVTTVIVRGGETKDVHVTIGARE